MKNVSNFRVCAFINGHKHEPLWSVLSFSFPIHTIRGNGGSKPKRFDKTKDHNFKGPISSKKSLRHCFLTLMSL